MSLKANYSAYFATFISVTLYTVVSSAFSSPKYAFPLGDLSYAFEIVDGDTTASEHDQCGFHFSGSHPAFSYVPLSLDAVIYPYVDLVVPDDSELKDWSFAVFFKPASVIGALVIVHYKYFGSLSEVTEVLLYIDNGLIKLNVVGGSGGTDTAILDMSVAVGSGYWTYVALSKVYDTGQLKLAMKTDTPSVSPQSVSSTTTNRFPTYKKLEVPGTMRVGNYHDGGNIGFQGEITCITVYDMNGLADDANEYPLVVDECQTPWGKSPVGLPLLPSTGCVTTTPAQTTTVEQTTTQSSTTTSQETITNQQTTTLQTTTTEQTSILTTTQDQTSTLTTTPDQTSTLEQTSTQTTSVQQPSSQQTTTKSMTTTLTQTETQHTNTQVQTTLYGTTPQETTSLQTSASQSTVTTLPVTCPRSTAPYFMSFKQFPQSKLTGVTTSATQLKQMVTVVTCAVLCSRTIPCVAFIVHLVDGVPQSCHLANTYGVSYVTSDIDTNLYVHSACL